MERFYGRMSKDRGVFIECLFADTRSTGTIVSSKNDCAVIPTKDIDWNFVVPISEAHFIKLQAFFKEEREAKVKAQEPVMKTVYKVLFKGEELVVGFSTRTREELLSFFAENSRIGFRVFDRNGVTKAILGPDITSQSSFLMSDIKKK
jgi:hypothetical protein